MWPIVNCFGELTVSRVPNALCWVFNAFILILPLLLFAAVVGGIVWWFTCK